MAYDSTEAADRNVPVAVIGLGCWLPGARNAKQLWENVVAKRREFRRMPQVRTPLADYYDETGKDLDKFYQSKVAVIDGFAFDWASYRIPESSFIRTDMSQWLALEVSHQALTDAGYSKTSVPRERTGVFIGNTCTGEGMRSNSLRLRWPVVARAMSEAAASQGLSSLDVASLIEATEASYKSIFPNITEDFVAGSISATIAGRICNYFDLHGGAFVIDAACASSLASVVTAANMLASRDLDLAIAGGVDISLDPFELVGFSRNGALSKSDIRPYDRRGDGFIAGEGSGAIVLKRLDDARRDGDSVYAVIRGWSMTSDGKAGIMQPIASQQAAAIQRALNRSGLSIEQLDFVEGHGTGTRAGDRTELEGLSIAFTDSGSEGISGRTCGIGSLKSLIGHTKATAGIASFIKAVAAVNRRVIPLSGSCEEPNDAFGSNATRLFPVRVGEARSSENILHAGVSAFGFGGINTHIVLESGDPPSSKIEPSIEERALLVSSQESETFIFEAERISILREHVDTVLTEAEMLSQSDLPDLAYHLAKEASGKARYRIIIIAESGDDLHRKLLQLRPMLDHDALDEFSSWGMPFKDIFIGVAVENPRIGFLFPGQGSQQLGMARTLIERFDWARVLAQKAANAVPIANFLDIIYRPIDRATNDAELSEWTKSLSVTEIAQPALCLASVLTFEFLRSIGIYPVSVGGHSLGELIALYAADVIGLETLFALAAARGQAMRGDVGRPGAMASLACDLKQAERLISEVSATVVVANINSPAQTVISGDSEAVEEIVQVAAIQNVASRRLPVSNAFHSPLVGEASRLFEAALPPLQCTELVIPVMSGKKGTTIQKGMDLRSHLASQITSPVDFINLVTDMKKTCDAFIEVGPGRVLSGLSRDILGSDICMPSAAHALKWNPNHAVALAYVNGSAIKWDAFYANRLVRPYIAPSKRVYLSNPAEGPFNHVKRVIGEKPSAPSSTGKEFAGFLSESFNLSKDQISDYLRRRGKFLTGIVQLDLATLSGDIAESFGDRNRAAAEQQGANSLLSQIQEQEKQHSSSIAQTLIELISSRTGYPSASILIDSRLLDDLNLDSIKAADVVAQAARQCGVAGALDATRFANASIEEIVAVLEAAAPNYRTEVVDDGLKADRTHVQDSFATSHDTVLELLVDLASERTGYPQSSVTAGSRLLDDLNLDSIKAGDLVAEAARRLGIAGKVDASSFANAALKEIAETLVALAPKQVVSQEVDQPHTIGPGKGGQSADADLTFTERYPTWTRNFIARCVPQTKPSPSPNEVKDRSLALRSFLILSDAGDSEIGEALKAAITSKGGSAQCLSFEDDKVRSQQASLDFTDRVAILPRSGRDEIPSHRLADMLSRVISVAQCPVSNGLTGVIYVQFGGGFFGLEGNAPEPETCNALGFARTLHLERKDLQVLVCDFALTIAPDIVAACLLDELEDQSAFGAVGYDQGLTRLVPIADLSEPIDYKLRSLQWAPGDVVLVTGGAKGIMAECALGVARETGATLVLVGRGHPGSTKDKTADSEIDRTIMRFEAEGLQYAYYSCDIVDGEALNKLINKIEGEIGPITGVIHGASVLRPTRIENLTVEGLLQEVGPKVLGAWNLCESLRGRNLKLFMAFSSLVVDHGMPWSSGYAFANEVMERVVQTLAHMEPSIPLQILSYGLWGQVGRPAVLKTNEHLLGVGLHDGEIPPEEGVRRCVEAFLYDSSSERLCIYGRSVGYGPWNQLRPEHRHDKYLRFVERVAHFEPDVELIARCHLNLERDLYLHDHVYNEMYIVPTVFALEMLAEAASALMGEKQICRLDAVEMPYPLVVDPQKGLEIELHAETQEISIRGFHSVNVSIFTEQSGFKTAVLSATVVFGDKRKALSQSINLGDPLPIDPQADLYGQQFFVGPKYRRMRAVYSTDPEKSLCLGKRLSAAEAALSAFGEGSGRYSRMHLVLGDPFFRDTLLHTSLLHHLDHMAFTLRIDRIEFFEADSPDRPVEHICVARRQWASGKDTEYELIAASQKGYVIERWTGYCTKALAKQTHWPLLEDLLDLQRAQQKDELSIRQTISAASQEMKLVAPDIGVICFAHLNDISVEERHRLEEELAFRLLGRPEPQNGMKLKWRETGRPILETLTNDSEGTQDVSFSHEGWYCLCSIGTALQGCDLATVSHRDRDQWVALFGFNRAPLLTRLEQNENLDLAGTRLWAALEAARKAFDGDLTNLSILRSGGSSVLFEAHSQNHSLLVLTASLHLTHGQQSIVALTVQSIPSAPLPLYQLSSPGIVIVRDEALGCDVLINQFSVSWKECMTQSRKVMPVCYVDWFHKTREMMLPFEEARRWVQGVLDGTTGLVARAIRVNIFSQVSAHDKLTARIWINELSETVAKWQVDFFKTEETDKPGLVARVTADGGITVSTAEGSRASRATAIWNDYGRFVRSENLAERVGVEKLGFSGLELGRIIFDAPAGPGSGRLLFKELMHPSLLDSDLVGNISSISFFGWLEHVRDRYFHAVAPNEMVRRPDMAKVSYEEPLCVESDMIYLREAFPFEDISVEMHLVSATERSVRLRYEFIRRKQGRAEKIAVGHQYLIWIRRDAQNVVKSADFPLELLSAFGVVQPREQCELI